MGTRQLTNKTTVGSKSHCRAVPAVPSPICCTSNLIFINYVSLKPYVSHIYFTVVNKTKIHARFNYHNSVMFMIFCRLILRCLHDFFMIVVLSSYIGL